MGELLLADEVYAVAGAAMEVFNELRGDYLEAVYQEAMEIELGLRAIPFRPQVGLPIYDKGRKLNKKYVTDLPCHERLIVEIKVAGRLTTRDEAQLLNYLHVTKLRAGVLLNFGPPHKFAWKRLIA